MVLFCDSTPKASGNKLDLSGQQISSIKQNAFAAIPALVSLDLSNNHVDNLDATFDGLSALNFLSIASNRVSKQQSCLTEVLSH